MLDKNILLKNVIYDAGNKALIFTFITREGFKVINVSIYNFVGGLYLKH